VVEQLTAHVNENRLAREHQRHLLAGASQLRKFPVRLLRIPQALDTVVTLVAVGELSLDVFEGALVLINGDENGDRHSVSEPSDHQRPVRLRSSGFAFGSMPELTHSRALSAYRQQAHLDAPLGAVWNLVGAPTRYPEWWPRVVEVRGERFEEGDEYVQVTRDPTGAVQSNFLVERSLDLREIRMSCQLTGTYAHWLLTPAQGGTFVELEMGMEPKRLGHRLFDVTMGRRYFRSWSEQSLDALRTAARRERDAARS
jgi:hypothetical protein